MRNHIGISSGSASASTPKPFPVDNATKPYWRSELHPIDEHRSSEKLPSECDVLIIGAGMSGVATAYHLINDAVKSNRSLPSIVLLEARQVCSGATGRNGGHVKTKTDGMQNTVKRWGIERATEIAQFHNDMIYAIKHAVETESLDCEFEMRRSYDIFLDEDEAKEKTDGFMASLKAGQKWTKEADCVEPKFADQTTSMHNVKAAFSVPACSLWPYKFVTQLLARLVDCEAVNLQTNTPVSRISRDSSSGANIVHTSRGNIKAQKLVLATNAYTGGILPTYHDKIIPYRGTASHISPKSPISPHLSHTYNINYQPHRVDYLNPRPDGGIVVGGAKWTFDADRSKWYDNWDDSVLLPEARPHFESLMQKHFRGWNESGAKVDYLWTGIMGLTKDEMPHVGEVPGSEGRQYVLAGFNGGGMSMIFLCAKGVARMIGEGVRFGETGLPKLFETTAERLEASR